MAFKAISNRKGIVKAVSMRLCPESPRVADCRPANLLESKTVKSEVMPQTLLNPDAIISCYTRQGPFLLSLQQARCHGSQESMHSARDKRPRPLAGRAASKLTLSVPTESGRHGKPDSLKMRQ